MSTLTEGQYAVLVEPFPPEQIYQLQKGGALLDYVGHAEVTERLNNADPDWTWEPFAVNEDGGPLIRFNDSVAELWINITIGGVTRPAVGTAKANAYSGEVAKELISDAIRNGAMRFGVALDLWKKHDNVLGPETAGRASTVRDPGSQHTATRPAPPAAPSQRVISDPNAAVPMTDGQSRNLYRLWHHVLNYTRDEYMDAVLIATGLEVTDDRQLNKIDAGKVISYLKQQAGEEDAPFTPQQQAPPVEDALFEPQSLEPVDDSMFDLEPF